MTAMKHLTDEQLNLELCKWLGWELHPQLGWYAPNDEGCTLPDHINDLSALGRIALIEAKLTDEQHVLFRLFLWDVVTDSSGESYGSIRATQEQRRAFVSPTTRQRVTAILLTVNPEVFQ